MKKNKKYTQAAAPQITDKNLELVATDLDYHAKSKLKDGYLGGTLSGHEADIRQDAVLMALRWWLDYKGKTEEWTSKRSISYALNFVKLQYAEKIKRRSECTYNDQKDTRITEHPYLLHELDYPQQSLLQMFELILGKCLLNGTISKPNALIARMVYIEGKTIDAVAKTLGRHPSAISQQLRRARLAVMQAAKTTDPTFA